MQSLPDDVIWSSSYSRDKVKILTSTRSIRSRQIIGLISVLGPCTTREMTEYVLTKSSTYEYKPIRKKDLKNMQVVLKRRLKNRKKGGSGIVYPGLIQEGYVFEIRNKKNIRDTRHVLSLKGCLFACGLNFSDKEIVRFIKNCGMNHLFFRFLYKIYEKTSLKFVKEIFLNPILDLIKRKRIDLEDDMYLNFGIIADTIGMTLYKKRKNLIKRAAYMFEDKDYRQIEELLKLIIYDHKPREDWYESIVDLYYKNKSRDFYDDYSEDQFEMSLFNKVMYQLFHGYHEAVPEDVPESIPKRSGFRLPHSKAWKEEQKWRDNY